MIRDRARMVAMMDTNPEHALRAGECVRGHLDALEQMFRNVGIEIPEQHQALRIELNQEIRELAVELEYTPDERTLRRWVREQFRAVLNEYPVFTHAVAYGTWKDDDIQRFLYHVCDPLDIHAECLRIEECRGIALKCTTERRALALAMIRGTLPPPRKPMPMEHGPLGYTTDGRAYARWIRSLTPEDRHDLHERISMDCFLKLPSPKNDAHWRTWEDYFTQRISADETAAQFQARHEQVRVYAEELLHDGYHERLVRILQDHA